MAANYNNAAWFYDRLARLIYGRALIHAQVYLLQYIASNSKILIVGGGTGWILEEIAKIHPSGLQVTYAEVSAHMIALSQKRNTAGNEVVFINDAIENISLPGNFDVVITPFLFDNFTGQTLTTVFNHIQTLIKPGGIWLNADFQLTGKWWQKVMLKSMLLFFKLLCSIEASKLPDIEKQFEKHGYKEIAQKTFYREFIVSKVYREA
jgi:ubiquinone/menaquinone biosynthesis C-methylase UbiE